MGCTHSKATATADIIPPLPECHAAKCDLPAAQNGIFCVNHDPRGKSRSLHAHSVN